MRDHTSRRLHNPCPVARQVKPKNHVPALLLLILGILAWSVLSNLHAQPPQPSDQPARTAPSSPDPTPPPPPSAGSPVPSAGPQAGPSLPPLLSFKIDPKTPLKDLLPAQPRSKRAAGPLSGSDLSRVPEVQFEARLAVTNVEAMKHIAHQMAKINHLNDKKTDGFIEALREDRDDLHGLPFAMGDACRTKGQRSKQFALAVALVRRAMQSSQAVVGPVAPVNAAPPPLPPVPVSRTSGSNPSVSRLLVSAQTEAPPTPERAAPPAIVAVPAQPLATPAIRAEPPTPEAFWAAYENLCTQEDRGQPKLSRAQCDPISIARIAALMQILAPLSEMHPGLVKHLSTVSHVEATRALARMALFLRTRTLARPPSTP